MYPALDKCVMPTLLRCLSHSCHSDDMGISTRTKFPSLSVTYSGFNECTFGPLASRRFPLLSSSSSCLIEINGLESSGTCQTLCNTNVKPLRRLSSILPIPIISKCCVLAGQGSKDKWESRTGYIYIYNIVIIIIVIRRDGSSIVVPIRIRTDSEPVA